MSKGPHPRILENVLSVVRVLGNSQDCPKHHFAMTPAKLDIRQLLAALCPRYQKRIACDRQWGSRRLTQSTFHRDLRLQAIGHRPFVLRNDSVAIHWPISQSIRFSADWASYEDEILGKN
jgi:hypothetical protein